jgi:hypothetical protein
LTDLYVTFGSTDNVSNPLSIQLLSFTAQCQAQDVVIEWSTASEENNDYFTILRSDDAEHYEEVAQISGAGNSNEVLNYSYEDWNAANGNYYYMLKQTDYNGQNETFKPVYVKCDNKEDVSLQVFYDGADVYATLKYAESGDKYQMVVIDHTGRIVYEETQFVNANHYYRIPVGNLAGGLYSIIYYNETGNTRMSEKFMVR